MNPKFAEVDLVPDEDLNTRLKFHVRKCFVEMMVRGLA
jgi:hypothetical protein